ncbi:hypothetical protein OVY48_06490 [Sphingobium sp. SA2]|uniref:hypothetical protein n=1 Tax=Sphingobium sp. SA2 TaxID=1524832 RepID=UPI0028C03540|nr:hypothetical protein [Sphingobium sp. SA2]MDT7533083.1 hypothetical protein [Sphingobium sp. SA2]
MIAMFESNRIGKSAGTPDPPAAARMIDTIFLDPLTLGFRRMIPPDGVEPSIVSVGRWLSTMHCQRARG